MSLKFELFKLHDSELIDFVASNNFKIIVTDVGLQRHIFFKSILRI